MNLIGETHVIECGLNDWRRFTSDFQVVSCRAWWTHWTGDLTLIIRW